MYLPLPHIFTNLDFVPGTTLAAGSSVFCDDPQRHRDCPHQACTPQRCHKCNTHNGEEFQVFWALWEEIKKFTGAPGWGLRIIGTDVLAES